MVSRPSGSVSDDDATFDEYLERALKGDLEDVEAFCARRGHASGALRGRLEALHRMISPAGPTAGAGDAATEPREPAVAAEPGLPFERLDGFRLLRRIGGGGMGIVFLSEE